MTFVARAILIACIFFVGGPVWAPPDTIAQQAQVRWAQLTRDQRVAVVQWVLHPGDMLRFIERNREDLRPYLETGVEDASFRQVEKGVQQNFDRFVANFAGGRPQDEPASRRQKAIEKEPRYWRLKQDLLLLKLVKDFRSAAFVLEGESLVTYRRENERNVLATTENNKLITFLATATSHHYAANHDPSSTDNLSRYELKQPLVVVPPDFAGHGIGNFLDFEEFIEFYPQYRKSRPEMPSTPPFDNSKLSGEKGAYFRTQYGEFVLAYYEEKNPTEVAKPAFHGTATEYELVLAPGNDIQSVGVQTTELGTFEGFRCGRLLGAIGT